MVKETNVDINCTELSKKLNKGFTPSISLRISKQTIDDLIQQIKQQITTINGCVGV